MTMQGDAEKLDDAMRREHERRQGVIDKARDDIEALGYDAVVIMASYTDESGHTVMHGARAGNWYSQSGMVQSFLDGRREGDRIDERIRRGRSAEE